MVDSRIAGQSKDRNDDSEKDLGIHPATQLTARKYEKKGLKQSVGLGQASTSNAKITTVEID